MINKSFPRNSGFQIIGCYVKCCKLGLALVHFPSTVNRYTEKHFHIDWNNNDCWIYRRYIFKILHWRSKFEFIVDLLNQSLNRSEA